MATAARKRPQARGGKRRKPKLKTRFKRAVRRTTKRVVRKGTSYAKRKARARVRKAMRQRGKPIGTTYGMRHGKVTNRGRHVAGGGGSHESVPRYSNRNQPKPASALKNKDQRRVDRLHEKRKTKHSGHSRLKDRTTPPSSSRTHTCSECGKTFDTKAQLRGHCGGARHKMK